MVDDRSSTTQSRSGVRRHLGWLSWLVGLVLLGAVVAVALHFAQARELLSIVERARPAWLGVAVLLQAGTYLAQGEVTRTVARAGGFRLRLGTVYRLSVLKLFVDQALPSGGLSGTAVLADELRRVGMPRPLVSASVVISIASYQAAYVAALAIALPLAVIPAGLRWVVYVVVGGFTVSALGWAATVIALSGRERPRLRHLLSRVRPLRALLDFLRAADGRVARSPQRLIECTAWQVAIFALDAATLWVLILALGAYAAPGGAYVSFMFASLLRSIGMVPGGLGTFEGMSVLSLKLMGVQVGTALAATLLFRGLSFWLPMLPGIWLYRGHYLRHRAPDHRSRSTTSL